jgi:ABC-2 type transport system ATP-binding protein
MTIVRSLTGGQRRRLDLGSRSSRPELVFLDEPTTGFDPKREGARGRRSRRCCELGKTILLTTHYRRRGR